MKMVYTNADRMIVGNAKNILNSHGINIVLKNEHASSIIGEVSPFDSWVELWVLDDSDYDEACKVLDGALSNEDEAPWICESCKEENNASFGSCWKCGTASPE